MASIPLILISIGATVIMSIEIDPFLGVGIVLVAVGAGLGIASLS
jgi:hypothetical protein